MMCNLTFKDGKMLRFCRKIDSLSTALNEFKMHFCFLLRASSKVCIL